MKSIHIYPQRFVKNDNSFVEDFFKNNEFNFIKSYQITDYKISQNDLNDNYIQFFQAKDLLDLNEKFIKNIFFISEEKEQPNYIENFILFNFDFILIKNWHTTISIDLSELESINLTNKSPEKENFYRILMEVKNRNKNQEILYFIIPQIFIINDKKINLRYNSAKLIEYINFNFFKYLHKFKKSNSQKKNI